MSVNAVEEYVASILTGQVTPGAPAAIEAWVMPPPVVQLTPNPQVFIWGGSWTEERHTNPRGRGQKRVTYALTIWIQSATSNDPADAYGPSGFVLLIETVLNILRRVTIPIPVTDPDTGATSIIQTIGEKMSVTHPPPTASADQRILWHNATLRLYVVEELGSA
jgi:hypothetical protein